MRGRMREVDWLVDLVGKSGVNKIEMGYYIRKDGEVEQGDSMDAIGRNGVDWGGAVPPYVR